MNNKQTTVGELMKWQHFQDFSYDYDSRCVPYDYDSVGLAGVYQMIRTACTLAVVHYVILKHVLWQLCTT